MVEVGEEERSTALAALDRLQLGGLGTELAVGLFDVVRGGQRQLATGCASTTPKYEISQDWDQAKLASVTIYRTNVFFHSGNPEKPFFYIDGMEVGKLGTGMAVTTKVTPGKHVISVHESLFFTPSYENGRIEYEFEAGKTYYVRYSKDFSGVAVTGKTAVPTGRTTFSFADENSYQERK